MRRVRQLYAAIFARIYPHELDFMRARLAKPAQALFLSMSRVDQRHALDTVYAIEAEANAHKVTDSATIYRLQQAALVHDVGKGVGYISISARIIYVLVTRWPSLHTVAKFFGLTSQLQLLREHPMRGAMLLASIGIDPTIVAWVENHHQPSNTFEYILAAVDSKN